MKLTPKMIELLTAMQAGKRVHFAPFMGRFNPKPYYYCAGMGQCTPQAKALLARKLVQKVNQEKYTERHELELTDSGKAWKP